MCVCVHVCLCVCVCVRLRVRVRVRVFNKLTRPPTQQQLQNAHDSHARPAAASAAELTQILTSHFHYQIYYKKPLL